MAYINRLPTISRIELSTRDNDFIPITELKLFDNAVNAIVDKFDTTSNDSNIQNIAKKLKDIEYNLADAIIIDDQGNIQYKTDENGIPIYGEHSITNMVNKLNKYYNEFVKCMGNDPNQDYWKTPLENYYQAAIEVFRNKIGSIFTNSALAATLEAKYSEDTEYMLKDSVNVKKDTIMRLNPDNLSYIRTINVIAQQQNKNIIAFEVEEPESNSLAMNLKIQNGFMYFDLDIVLDNGKWFISKSKVTGKDLVNNFKLNIYKYLVSENKYSYVFCFNTDYPSVDEIYNFEIQGIFVQSFNFNNSNLTIENHDKYWIYEVFDTNSISKPVFNETYYVKSRDEYIDDNGNTNFREVYVPKTKLTSFETGVTYYTRRTQFNFIKTYDLINDVSDGEIKDNVLKIKNDQIVIDDFKYSGSIRKVQVDYDICESVDGNLNIDPNEYLKSNPKISLDDSVKIYPVNHTTANIVSKGVKTVDNKLAVAYGEVAFDLVTLKPNQIVNTNECLYEHRTIIGNKLAESIETNDIQIKGTDGFNNCGTVFKHELIETDNIDFTKIFKTNNESIVSQSVIDIIASYIQKNISFVNHFSYVITVSHTNNFHIYIIPDALEYIDHASIDTFESFFTNGNYVDSNKHMFYHFIVNLSDHDITVPVFKKLTKRDDEYMGLTSVEGEWFDIKSNGNITLAISDTEEVFASFYGDVWFPIKCITTDGNDVTSTIGNGHTRLFCDENTSIFVCYNYDESFLAYSFDGFTWYDCSRIGDELIGFNFGGLSSHFSFYDINRMVFKRSIDKIPSNQSHLIIINFNTLKYWYENRHTEALPYLVNQFNNSIGTRFGQLRFKLEQYDNGEDFYFYNGKYWFAFKKVEIDTPEVYKEYWEVGVYKESEGYFDHQFVYSYVDDKDFENEIDLWGSFNLHNIFCNELGKCFVWHPDNNKIFILDYDTQLNGKYVTILQSNTIKLKSLINASERYYENGNVAFCNRLIAIMNDGSYCISIDEGETWTRYTSDWQDALFLGGKGKRKLIINKSNNIEYNRDYSNATTTTTTTNINITKVLTRFVSMAKSSRYTLGIESDGKLYISTSTNWSLTNPVDTDGHSITFDGSTKLFCDNDIFIAYSYTKRFIGYSFNGSTWYNCSNAYGAAFGWKNVINFYDINRIVIWRTSDKIPNDFKGRFDHYNALGIVIDYEHTLQYMYSHRNDSASAIMDDFEEGEGTLYGVPYENDEVEDGPYFDGVRWYTFDPDSGNYASEGFVETSIPFNYTYNTSDFIAQYDNISYFGLDDSRHTYNKNNQLIAWNNTDNEIYIYDSENHYDNSSDIQFVKVNVLDSSTIKIDKIIRAAASASNGTENLLIAIMTDGSHCLSLDGGYTWRHHDEDYSSVLYLNPNNKYIYSTSPIYSNIITDVVATEINTIPCTPSDLHFTNPIGCCVDSKNLYGTQTFCICDNSREYNRKGYIYYNDGAEPTNWKIASLVTYNPIRKLYECDDKIVGETNIHPIGINYGYDEGYDPYKDFDIDPETNIDSRLYKEFDNNRCYMKSIIDDYMFTGLAHLYKNGGTPYKYNLGTFEPTDYFIVDDTSGNQKIIFASEFINGFKYANAFDENAKANPLNTIYKSINIHVTRVTQNSKYIFVYGWNINFDGQILYVYEKTNDGTINNYKSSLSVTKIDYLKIVDDDVIISAYDVNNPDVTYTWNNETGRFELDVNADRQLNCSFNFMFEKNGELYFLNGSGSNRNVGVGLWKYGKELNSNNKIAIKNTKIFEKADLFDDFASEDLYQELTFNCIQNVDLSDLEEYSHLKNCDLISISGIANNGTFKEKFIIITYEEGTPSILDLQYNDDEHDTYWFSIFKDILRKNTTNQTEYQFNLVVQQSAYRSETVNLLNSSNHNGFKTDSFYFDKENKTLTLNNFGVANDDQFIFESRKIAVGTTISTNKTNVVLALGEDNALGLFDKTLENIKVIKCKEVDVNGTPVDIPFDSVHNTLVGVAIGSVNDDNIVYCVFHGKFPTVLRNNDLPVISYDNAQWEYRLYSVPVSNILAFDNSNDNDCIELTYEYSTIASEFDYGENLLSANTLLGDWIKNNKNVKLSNSLNLYSDTSNPNFELQYLGSFNNLLYNNVYSMVFWNVKNRCLDIKSKLKFDTSISGTLKESVSDLPVMEDETIPDGPFILMSKSNNTRIANLYNPEKNEIYSSKTGNTTSKDLYTPINFTNKGVVRPMDKNHDLLRSPSLFETGDPMGTNYIVHLQTQYGVFRYFDMDFLTAANNAKYTDIDGTIFDSGYNLTKYGENCDFKRYFCRNAYFTPEGSNGVVKLIAPNDGSIQKIYETFRGVFIETEECYYDDEYCESHRIVKLYRMHKIPYNVNCDTLLLSDPDYFTEMDTKYCNIQDFKETKFGLFCIGVEITAFRTDYVNANHYNSHIFWFNGADFVPIKSLMNNLHIFWHIIENSTDVGFIAGHNNSDIVIYYFDDSVTDLMSAIKLDTNHKFIPISFSIKYNEISTPLISKNKLNLILPRPIRDNDPLTRGVLYKTGSLTDDAYSTRYYYYTYWNYEKVNWINVNDEIPSEQSLPTDMLLNSTSHLDQWEIRKPMWTTHNYDWCKNSIEFANKLLAKGIPSNKNLKAIGFIILYGTKVLINGIKIISDGDKNNIAKAIIFNVDKSFRSDTIDIPNGQIEISKNRFGDDGFKKANFTVVFDE